MAKHEQYVEEGSMAFSYTLVALGAILCVMALVESYLQMTNAPYTLLTVAQGFGLFTGYKTAVQPNRGIWHPIGWTGSAFFCIMMLYSVRKHFSFMYGMGPLRHWLNVHMFLGIVATIFVTTHTTYKVGGIVSISFWSMVLVAGSGVIGRYIYIQIPRGISGNELREDEIEDVIGEINEELEKYSSVDPKIMDYYNLIAVPKMVEGSGITGTVWAMIKNDLDNFARVSAIKSLLKKNPEIPSSTRKRILKLLKEKSGLVRSNNFLSASHKILHYWHVFHKPFALIMFVIMFLHIGVYYIFRVES